ncbi:MAG: OmpA family protein [Holophagales bacterium]|jgi:chemotaxis protein MotB|nr:OmpA family protein [Holophagales bacterium]
MAEKQPDVIIKFVKKKGGHAAAHGGAWKIAYADLVTAMMAFFLLMWLLAMAPKEVLAGIAGYAREGSEFFKTEQGQSILKELGKGILPGTRGLKTQGEDDGDKESKITEDPEQAAMEAVRLAIEKAFDTDKFLSAFRDHITMDFTEEGLRIQIRDQGDKALFDSGSDVMNGFAISILREIAKELAKLRNHVVVGGHTDAVPFMSSGRTNWDLSTARANTALRTMIASGLPLSQVKRVTGYAETIPFEGHDPRDPQNRRISIVVLSSSYEAKENALRQSKTQEQPPPPAKASPQGVREN